MENFVETYLNSKGYNVNSKAQAVIKECDNWYANRVIEDFHERTTVHGTPYQLNRMGFAKRCCADDANLCEIAEVNGGNNEEQQVTCSANLLLRKERFRVLISGVMKR